jgi:ADP-dependent NAD(P)H-hydrate dehydratase / NAD(P)H-hydrate epimerase
VADVARLKGAAAEARTAYLSSGGDERPFTGEPLDRPGVLVDALLGTGLDRVLAGLMLEAVECMNHADCPVLSLDIPSGLHADTGAIMGAAVNADVTMTFIALKPGLLTGAGPQCCGELLFDSLDTQAGWYTDLLPRARRIQADEARLPRRARDAHKGAFGHVLVIGGDHGMGGAIRLTAEAALRGGSGLVSVATRSAHITAMLAGLPEAMTYAVEADADIDVLLKRATVVAIGPGLGRDIWGQVLFEKALATNCHWWWMPMLSTCWHRLRSDAITGCLPRIPVRQDACWARVPLRCRAIVS